MNTRNQLREGIKIALFLSGLLAIAILFALNAHV